LQPRAHTKGEHVLRFEATVHNAKQLRCRPSLDNSGQIIARLAGMAARVITALLALRDHVIAPILAGIRSPRMGRNPRSGPPSTATTRPSAPACKTLFQHVGIDTLTAAS
jgi:hypothetical protein